MKRTVDAIGASRLTVRAALLGALLAAALAPILTAAAHTSPVDAMPDETAVADADWPQLGRDAQRTGASPQRVAGPYRFYWRWAEVPFASRAQPVVASGRLFIGSLNGTMYAVDAAYDARGGPPSILWQRDLGSPIRAGAAVSGDVVLVGTHHGALHGLEASSGRILWSFPTGGALLASPLVSWGVAYLGSADGAFYALRASDGALLWKREVGSPILGSAAMSISRDRVFFMAEDMRAYALAASDGSLLWRTEALQGQSASDRWPVVAGDLVLFRTQPLVNFTRLLHAGDQVLDSAGPRLSDWEADWALVRPKVLSHLETRPQEQSLYALEASSGQPRGLPPVLYTFGNNDAPAPPVVHRGSVYLPYRPRHGIQTDSPVAVHVTTRYDAELGRMDPTTLDVTGLASPDQFRYQFRLTSDEPAVLTLAGELLLVDSWERLGGIDLADGSLVAVVQQAVDGLPCQWGVGGPMPGFYEGCPFPGPRVGEGMSRSGAAVGSGRIFWRVDASGLASIGPDDGSEREPLAARVVGSDPGPLPGPKALPASALASFVWAEPPLAPSVPEDLRARLEREVEAIVSAEGHMMPYYLERGHHGRGSFPPEVTNDSEPASVADSNGFWYDQGELLLSLSRAYPYLGPSLQERVRSYLQAEMGRFPPLERLPWPVDPWLKEGRARESYPVPMRSSLGSWPPPGVPIQTLYALWAYGRYTGDWGYLASRWEQIKELFHARKGAIDSYAEVAGAIGYARIARRLGQEAEASAGEAAAVGAMQAGYDFGAWLERANRLCPADTNRPQEKPGRRAGVFFGLTPEVGRYLRETNLGAVEWALRDVAGYPGGSYLWYATRVGLQGELGESSYHSPEIGWSVFLAEAYVRQATREQLRYWLDRAWGIGDLYSLQKLVATIEAP